MAAQIAEAKAASSALFGVDGEGIMSLQKNRPAFFDQVTKLTRLPLMPGLGGIVIKKSECIVGALGVSGSTPEQDDDIARFGLRSVEL